LPQVAERALAGTDVTSADKLAGKGDQQSLRGSGTPARAGTGTRQCGRLSERVRQVNNVESGDIGRAPVPDFTKPVDFGEWAAKYIKWGRQEGQPPRVRVLVRLLEMATGTTL
jgi:hypothetical protein